MTADSNVLAELKKIEEDVVSCLESAEISFYVFEETRVEKDLPFPARCPRIPSARLKKRFDALHLMQT